MRGPGTIFHGRNLDYNFPGLPNVTYTATFISNGTVQYMGTAFIGCVRGPESATPWHPCTCTSLRANTSFASPPPQYCHLSTNLHATHIPLAASFSCMLARMMSLIGTWAC